MKKVITFLTLLSLMACSSKGQSLVAYFSATGTTAKAAKTLAEATGADLFEITPAIPYTSADLNWRDSSSRSTLEMKNPSSRPEIKGKVGDISKYDTIYVGFPIWWYTAPTIINTFLESYDLSGKTIVLFATSGGSDLGDTATKLSTSAKGAKIVSGGLLNGNPSVAKVKAWAEKVSK